MGNCQATDAEAAIVEHPNGRIERLYWPTSARQIMVKNPGHYVAVYKGAPTSTTEFSIKPKLKLLPPTAILIVGKNYRIVSFEDVLGEISETINGTLQLRTFKINSKAHLFPTTVQKDTELDSASGSTVGLRIGVLSKALYGNGYGQTRRSLRNLLKIENAT